LRDKLEKSQKTKGHGEILMESIIRNVPAEEEESEWKRKLRGKLRKIGCNESMLKGSP
jgi:hypothetical protein